MNPGARARTTQAPHRQGAVLIITAALCALLVVLTFTFLVSMRADAQATAVIGRQAQARILMMAACNYVLEAGRVGWGQETFGWVDVRDGKLGPKPAMTGSDDDSRFRIGSSARFPLSCWERPPYAISQRDPNPIDTRLNSDGTPLDTATFGQPYLSNPDPMLPTTVTTYGSWRDGDPRMRPESLGMGWFRVYRDGPATFIIACGSGGTYGFKDWTEVDPASRKALFFNTDDNPDDPTAFNQALDAEARSWYRIEWSPAVSIAPSVNLTTGVDTYAWHQSYSTPARNARASLHPGRDNVCGTIQWVQRLRFPPDQW